MRGRAALYGRGSTDDQTESVPTQLDNGRRWAEGHGFDVVAEFVDDARSRAEFARRPGLAALRARAAAGDFDAVIARDETRLGGDMLRVGLLIQDLADHDVALWYYASGERVRTDDATSRLIVTVRNWGSEVEREKISSRTRENLERRARRGFVAGGVVFGYSNERSEAGVRRVVRPDEAAIVREIFERAARGDGVKAIAHALTARGVPPPRRGAHGWSPSAIHAMLRRPLYIGRPEWGHTHKTYRHGTKIRTETHAHELVTVEAPELAIVPVEIWEAVRTRVERRERATGTRRGGPSKYLLSGFSRCTCGGPIQTERTRMSYTSVPAYMCGWHRERGAAICPNTLRRPVEIVDAALVGWIREHVLSPSVVRAVVLGVRRALAQSAATPLDERKALEVESRRVKAEIERLTRALAMSTSAVKPLVAALDARARRLREVEGQLAALRAAPSQADAFDGRAEREIVDRLEQLGATLRAQPVEGRRVLQALLLGPLRWTPVITAEGPRYQIRGAATIGPLCLVERADRGGDQVASPAGFEPA